MMADETPRFQFHDGTLVPTLNEMQAALGEQLSAIVEQRLQVLRTSSDPQEIVQACACVNGIFIAATHLDRLPSAFASAFARSVGDAAMARIQSLGVPVQRREHSVPLTPNAGLH